MNFLLSWNKTEYKTAQIVKSNMVVFHLILENVKLEKRVTQAWAAAAAAAPAIIRRRRSIKFVDCKDVR